MVSNAVVEHYSQYADAMWIVSSHVNYDQIRCEFVGTINQSDRIALSHKRRLTV